ncbi:hypothetical protein [Scopulibacillus cellulosilyticus]|uniref:SR1 protein n=1 Tax=Scopulibacillus cellulosilyticus TaxID=2665665 RepID=A0ABW2PW61_9BACL
MEQILLNCSECRQETKHVLDVSKQDVSTGCNYTVKVYCRDCGKTTNWVEFINTNRYKNVADL